MRSLRIAAAFILVLLSACRRPEHALPAAGEFPGAPVIIISIDTLRADHLPLFGYKAVETPNIDALRRDGILFTNAWSHVPLTLPSHVTLLTGTLPAENGVRDNIGYSLTSRGASLPEVLHANGYATGAAVSAYVLRGETGLRALFDDYDDEIAFQPGSVLGDVQRPGAQTEGIAERWIAAHDRKPFFFLLHLFEPHSPYTPAEPFRSRFANPYDGEIATADAIVGTFVASLKKSGIYDRAVIVLLSDHGEGLGDHGEQEHGILLYRESLHVPLLLKLPKNAASNATVDSPVGLIDIMPTIASLTRTKAPSGLRGVALTQLPAQPRRIFSETMYPRLHLGWSDLRSLADATHHFIDAPRAELYDMQSDPGEKTSVVADQRRVFASFRSDIAQYPRELQQPARIDPEQAKKLADLGYLTAQSSTSGALPDPKDHIADLATYEEASRALAGGQPKKAIASLRQVIARNPNFTDALQQLATAYEAAGQYNEAAETYRQVLSNNPAMTEVVALSLGAVYLNLGRFDDARAHAQLAMNRNPGAAHLLLGRVAFAQNDFARADAEAREASRDKHVAAQAAMLNAETLVKRGRAAEAVALLEKQKVSGAQLPRGFEAGRADALVHAGRIPAAESAFREEIRRFPHDSRAYGSLAAIYMLQGNVAAADAVMQELVTANPDRDSYDLASNLFDHFRQPALAAQWRNRAASVAQ
ncbi:MAG TPA: sulfatase-like hydrolase/transferase [Thermoanaerobaculia bacterium]|nr:sulfatase-like hydrolase/transferase [Thermoanaerobaculia bacterium]